MPPHPQPKAETASALSGAFLGEAVSAAHPAGFRGRPRGGWRLGLLPPISKQGSGTGWEVDESGWKPSFSPGPPRTPCLTLEPLYAALMCDLTRERVAWWKDSSLPGAPATTPSQKASHSWQKHEQETVAPGEKVALRSSPGFLVSEVRGLGRSPAEAAQADK